MYLLEPHSDRRILRASPVRLYPLFLAKLTFGTVRYLLPMTGYHGLVSEGR